MQYPLIQSGDGIGRTGTVVGCLLAEKTGNSFEEILKTLRSKFNSSPKALFSQIPESYDQLIFIQKYILWKYIRPPKHAQ